MACGWIARRLTGGRTTVNAGTGTETGGGRGAAQAAKKDYRDPGAAVAFGRRLALGGIAVLLLWALAAGTWRALRHTEQQGFVLRLVQPEWLAVLGGSLFYAAGALGAALLILLAAGLVGGAFGFLFGLPRMDGRGAPQQLTQNIAPGQNAQIVSGTSQGGAAPAGGNLAQAPGGASSGATGDGRPAQQAAATAASARAAAATERTYFRMSPALNEIADWLTKIIVGLGLVQAGAIAAGFERIMFWLLGPAGLHRFPLAAIVVPACMLIGVIGGFILVYLMMTLVMGREIADAALDLDAETVRAKEEADREREELQRKASDRRRLVGTWSGEEIRKKASVRTLRAELPLDDAAREFAALDFDGLTSNSERNAWINIRWALGDEAAASAALNKMLT
jgi:hypothetical protein